MQSEVMVRIEADHVVTDNAWLWRADHDIAGLVKEGRNYVRTGLEVLGDNVTTYGLAVEHTLGDLVQWKGNDGRCYFYQSELPYDVKQSEFGDAGSVGFRVDAEVQQFAGYGVGVYSFFRDFNVTIENGIEVPDKTGVTMQNAFTKFLTGLGGIEHVINGEGGSTVENHDSPQYVCGY